VKNKIVPAGAGRLIAQKECFVQMERVSEYDSVFFRIWIMDGRWFGFQDNWMLVFFNGFGLAFRIRMIGLSKDWICFLKDLDISFLLV